MFLNVQGLLLALGGTGFTFGMTALGAAVVFLFRREIKDGIQQGFLGFAAGIMIAASVWSLLLPAIEMAGENGVKVPWFPAAAGFLFGGLFLAMMDKLLPFLPSMQRAKAEEDGFKRNIILVFAITLHNIPEGMAVGLACALAAAGNSPITKASALALAFGIGIQNLPEGAAIALPLRKEGMSAWKAFCLGALSGLVEPVAGVLTVLAVAGVQAVLPWLLSFAAGAMFYVVLEELIPGAHLEKGPGLGTAGAMAAFVLMMVLDVALG